MFLKFLKCLGFLFLIFGSQSCREEANASEKPVEIIYKNLPAFNKLGVTAVVEIPAGANHKIEYEPETNLFKNDKTAEGKERVINFLPYPANYGFIPSTIMSKEEGGDGDPMDVLIICESLPTGTVIPVKILAALVIKDAGELDTKLIAVPVEKEKQVLKVNDFQEFMINYDSVRRIIESWFLNYEGPGNSTLIGWRDDDFAISEIKKWSGENDANDE